jgi:hypothetical protein
VRKPLKGGGWIELKFDLCAADLSAGGKALQQGDIQGYRIARVAAWLVAWSIRDHGQPVPLGETETARIAALGALSVRGFNEIWDLVDAHDKASEAEVAGQGDPSSPAGAPPSPPGPDAPVSPTDSGSSSPS